MLLMSSLEETLGQFHPVVLHFPITLFTIALVCDLWSYFKGKEDYRIGTLFVIAGLIACAPTLLTGLAASEAMDQNDPVLIRHRTLAFSTTGFASLYTGIRIAVKWWKLEVPRWFYISMSFILVAMVSWTSDYGGLITRGVTPFSSNKPHEVAMEETHHHHHDEDVQVKTVPVDLLQNSLGRAIGVKDVIPIFRANRCQQCHPHNFSDGQPVSFSQDDDPDAVFLPRGPDGKLLDITKSNFYRMVIVENAMPKGPKGKSLGLSPSERLTLLMWLCNGAPTE